MNNINKSTLHYNDRVSTNDLGSAGLSHLFCPHQNYHSPGHLVMVYQLLTTSPQEVLLYSNKTSCQHSVTSQYVFFQTESSKTYCDITWCLQGVCGVCRTTPWGSLPLPPTLNKQIMAHLLWDAAKDYNMCLTSLWVNGTSQFPNFFGTNASSYWK